MSLHLQVEGLVERMLPDGVASVRLVARSLGMSPRTLQRRLAAEGTSFDDIREAARRARALELIGKNHHAVRSVANQLGFSGPRSFRRAFRRWTGTTPSAMSQISQEQIGSEAAENPESTAES